MVVLSYSSLYLLHNHPHCWLNKQMGIQQEDTAAFREGKEGHKIIQSHLCGKEENPNLSHITYKFPVVEEKDFDERTKFWLQLNKDFALIGYADGLNPEQKTLLEIKLSSSPWSLSKFQKAIQRKIYSLGFPWVEEAVLVTGQRLPDKWESEPIKYFTVNMTDADRKEAKDYIKQGIEIFKSGNFTRDLVEGRCTDFRCPWGRNCYFK